MPERLNLLTHWLKNDLGLPAFDIAPASADASFRRYFRVSFNGETRIVMDAPPDKENIEPFMHTSKLLHDAGLNVPEVLASDIEQGFLLLSDLGSEQYLAALNEESVDRLYADALDALALIQSRAVCDDTLPPYDRSLLLQEMELFREWYLGWHLGLELSEQEQNILNEAFSLLAENALEQPQVFVHRDYHSRNLMVCENNPGILDFQDAVAGPVTYDLVSLLRDCYITWPREQVEAWALGFHQRSLDNGVLNIQDKEQFLRWFDLMGVQRHLKAIGIFARLNHRDGKPGYLDDIPRTLTYVQEVCRRYPRLSALDGLIQARL
ncbi:MAG: phosphotransferase [Gammaproteobacteria bacterium]|nr:phosphotransferase [Gammaproteobacteria bacterium]